MRVHLAAGRGALTRRVAFFLGVIVVICAMLLPSTSVAGTGHAKHHRAAHHKRRHRHHEPAQKPHRAGSSTSTNDLRSHGQTLSAFNASQSNNWFGYNQGALEPGKGSFTSISGDWTVPTATSHTKGQDESSSDWIGIGGGCMDTSCATFDPTLIQTGTEQDVSSNGTASYSAWYELIPLPSIPINMIVQPGDHMHASVVFGQNVPGLWTITLQDVTRGENFSTTVPYTSTEGSAEWIEETPLVIGTNAGFAPMPNLSAVPFTLATANGAPANLQASEEIQLIDSSGHVIGTPSAPLSSQSFDDCAWATTCP
jgi:hypothetical protein